MLPIKWTREDEEALSEAWARWWEVQAEIEAERRAERERIFQAWWSQATDEEREEYFKQQAEDRVAMAGGVLGLLFALAAGFAVSAFFKAGWIGIIAASVGGFFLGVIVAPFLGIILFTLYTLAVWAGMIWIGYALYSTYVKG